MAWRLLEAKKNGAALVRAPFQGNVRREIGVLSLQRCLFDSEVVFQSELTAWLVVFHL